ncbi:NAD(P)/FAD-dependent oxidoreductase [Oharaeibacter diazotrophicus]|uniref:Glycine/D-amino acid oxidase-like deaminating enzyme n=2 Tax=Oharaeibacter diazotrophicus TaxID=1920512 RepID=A0A4R6R9Y0_9HYPH|nr:FAD-dependent oxidoreductase [Oharaeibacter diazotrophicus]TDP82436.1 glycine/D-amino acid oxidase-like deaminating enzyme [Oharaeibacter diazotrophicus]BBE72801.1 gamma-glutamylputrescine oxidoreductase [Pleomorphomonas sp. SM30]
MTDPSRAFRTPIWPGTAAPSIPTLPLGAAERADLVVVGGGILGLATALSAARSGLAVRLVEADAIGRGASALNGGQVIPGLKYDPAELVARFGEVRGRALVDFAATTADRVFDLIAAEGLAVPHARNGWIQAAVSETALAAGHARARAWQALGAPAETLDAAGIAAFTGARGYVGGWIDRRAGTIDPLAYVQELARIAAAAGVAIAAGAPATGLRREGGGWVVTAGGAEIRAPRVVVATNAATDGLIPGLARTLVPLHSFQIATAPLPERLLAGVLPGGQAVSDSRRILVYHRRGPGGRIVLGGRGRMGLPRSPADWAHLERALTRLYPALAGTPIDARWFGRVAVTTDHLPHLHRPEPGLFAFVGCQGRGVGLMTAMGLALGPALAADAVDALPFPVSPIRPIPLHGLRQIGVAAAITSYRLLDALER